jgi:tetratricopeptide (TPR) repeat protein
MKTKFILFVLFLTLTVFTKLSFAQTDSSYIELAKTALNNKNYKEVINYCNQALVQNPKLAESYYIKAKCRLEQKLYIDVFNEINKAIAIKECYSEAFALRAETFYELKDYRQARKSYYQALACNNKEAIYYFNIGVLETKIYKWNSAIDNFTRALKYNPSNKETFENRAYAYSMVGEHTLAIHDYDSILAIDPKRDDIFIKRGVSVIAQSIENRRILM